MIEIIIGLLYTVGWIWCFIEWREEYRSSHKEDKWIELAVFVVFMVVWLPMVILLLVALIAYGFIAIFKKITTYDHKSYRR